MRVVKRNGEPQDVDFNKITHRISALCAGLDSIVDPILVAKKTIDHIADMMTTSELDIYAAELAYSMVPLHIDYGRLASRIYMSNIHKNTIIDGKASFSRVMSHIYNTGLSDIDSSVMEFINANADALDAMVIDSNDYKYNYFSMNIFARQYFKYLMGTRKGKIYKIKPFDRPQYVFLRVAIMLYMNGESKSTVYTPDWTLEGYYDKLQKANVWSVAHSELTAESASADVLQNIRECYLFMSRREFTHASPTLFNACVSNGNGVSCFLLACRDSAQKISEVANDCCNISKCAGGIGVDFSYVRSSDSMILGTGGKAAGVVPFCTILNKSMNTYNQGGRRNGSLSPYLELWHSDIINFLRMHTSRGSKGMKAPLLFPATWARDLFFERLLLCSQSNQQSNWSLFCPNTVPLLHVVYDGMNVCSKCGWCDNELYLEIKWLVDNKHHTKLRPRTDIYPSISLAIIEEKYRPTIADIKAGYSACEHSMSVRKMFTELYTQYEAEGLATARISPEKIMDEITHGWRETGLPYMCSADTTNRMSSNVNYGTVCCSNLCTEIMQTSKWDSYACCVLGSINVVTFVRSGATLDHILLPEYAANPSLFNMRNAVYARKYDLDAVYDFAALYAASRQLARNLDMLIDSNTYPIAKCRTNAILMRSIAIGIQALATLFVTLRIPFVSDAATQLSVEIWETIYFAALSESTARAAALGPYPYYNGSPASKGLLHHDLWKQEQTARIPQQTELLGLQPHELPANMPLEHPRWDWAGLRAAISAQGLRNALLTSGMPTVSTSAIFGGSEQSEPYHGHIYVKSTLSGNYTIYNTATAAHMLEIGAWSQENVTNTTNNEGQLTLNDAEIIIGDKFAHIPRDIFIKYIYAVHACVWQVSHRYNSMRTTLCGAYIDQAQSLNTYSRNNTNKLMTTIMMNSWSLGLKTITYYTRTRSENAASKNDVAARFVAASAVSAQPTEAPKIKRGDCESCSG